MIAFDPELIVIDGGVQPNFQTGKMEASWQMNVPDQGETAYVKIDEEFRKALKELFAEHGVIGFKYDFENNPDEFGIILQKDEEEDSGEEEAPEKPLVIDPSKERVA